MEKIVRHSVGDGRSEMGDRRWEIVDGRWANGGRREVEEFVNVNVNVNEGSAVS